jgi:membrane-associated phospholipid phosphatase
VRSSEWVSFLYFLYLASVCWLRPLPLSRRAQVSGVSLALLALILAVAYRAPAVIRDWAPFVYISFGYYLTGRLFVKPSERIEAWLLGWDRRLFGDPTTRFSHWPAWFVGYLDIVYTFCFVLLPGGYLALVASGHPELSNHYWTLVAAADLAAFAPLSVFQTRPPWILEDRPPVLAARSAHRLASFMVQKATIRVNTFPSGHVAVSLAVAFAVIGTLPWTGFALLLLAASIAIACVVGRYHYAIDVVSGALLGLVVCGIAALCGV